jgi:hypothetical protein
MKDVQLAGLEAKGQLVLRVELGLSHLPWSKCIEGTREMENLKIITAPSATWRSLISSLLVKIHRADSRHKALLKFTKSLHINLGSILSSDTRNPVHRYPIGINNLPN